MKNLAIILSILLSSFLSYSQQTISGSITHDGLQRDYILYVPDNYSGNLSVPLVLNFHGFGSNAFEQMLYGDFRSIADTAGFLLVHPKGTLYSGTTHWNVGGWTIGSTVDDVGFTEALIDSLSIQYNIDNARIYSTGMSNGGFMSFLLACQLSDRIAAIASVTGSMTPETFNNSNAQHPTPILQIHGTSDPLVLYNGTFFSKSIVEVLQFWVDYNNCNPEPLITALPDIDPNDGSTVEQIVYEGGDNGVTVEHYKITGGAHTWPGSALPVAGTNYDIDASAEIWNFFTRYDINGLIQTTGIKQPNNVDNNFMAYPNPTNSILNIDINSLEPMDYTLLSSHGNIIQRGILNSSKQQIDLSYLSPNVYFLKIGNNIIKVMKTN